MEDAQQQDGVAAAAAGGTDSGGTSKQMKMEDGSASPSHTGICRNQSQFMAYLERAPLEKLYC
jgi:hypothetical protein